MGLLYIAASASIICGKLLFSIFAESFGRKKSLLLAAVIMFFGLNITLLSSSFNSIFVSIGGIMLGCLGGENAFQCIYCIAT
jgi:predicted MFS family arabinose efflux permease